MTAKRKSLIVWGIFLGLFFCTSVRAEESAPTSREQQLEKMVADLVNRVGELEKEVASLKGGIATTPTKSEPAAQVETEKKPERQDGDFRVFWKDGMRFETEDQAFKIKLGGETQLDAFSGDDIDKGDSLYGARFRRARLNLSGNVYKDLEFKWQYDYADDGAAKWVDVYLGYLGWSHADVRVGQFKEPFGLEQLASTNDITFLELSPLNALVPGRQTGLMLYNDVFDGRVSWAVGAFLPSNDFGDAVENDAEPGEWDVTARITGLPWYVNDGEKLLHVGAAYSHRAWDGDALSYGSRGSYSRGSSLVKTDTFDAENIDLLGSELAVVFGPASVQSEYVLADVDPTDGGPEDYQTAYVQASYFLTGELRPYKSGVFGRVRPKKNFSPADDTWGAWELAARYSRLDLGADEVSMDGGELDDITLGLNWYLNPNTKIMWDYVHSEADDAPTDIDDTDVLEVRFQLAF